MNTKGFAQAADQDAADIVIVGAGIAGLYCALRLFEADPTRRITIVERLNRIGGRLDTDIIEFDDGAQVREEEGGMRFNFAMAELMNLTKRMGLCDEIVPFPMSSEGDTNRYHLRGCTFTRADAAWGSNRIWGEIYDLNENERGLGPTQIVGQVFRRVREANGDCPVPESPDEWTQFRQTCTWNGVTLNNWHMWGLLRDMGHSEECIHMLTETIGFAGPFKAPINAGEAFQILADFPKDPAYQTFRHGFSVLPHAIADQLEEQFGDQFTILLSSNVDRITRSSNGLEFELTEAPPGQNSNAFTQDGTVKTVTADQTIIAAATAGMKQLFATSPVLNQHAEADRLWAAMHAARGMSLMKINLYFDQAWWECGDVTPPVQFGPNFSSLPVNAVYPFYALNPGDKIPDGPAALTIYCDFTNTHFWQGLQSLSPTFESTMQRAEDDRVPQRLWAASRPLVDEAKQQLALLFGIPSIPEPLLTSYRLWDGSDDFEFAYHQWRLGVEDSEIRAYLSQPLPGVHFCNEAISDMHGWANGSLRSADLALAHFGIDPMPHDPSVGPQAGVKPRVEYPTVSGIWGA